MVTDAPEVFIRCPYAECPSNMMVQHFDDAIENLIEAWNTRHRRTCHVKQTGCATGICSDCGAEFMASVVSNMPPDYVESAHHCPNCGAEIVE